MATCRAYACALTVFLNRTCSCPRHRRCHSSPCRLLRTLPTCSSKTSCSSRLLARTSRIASHYASKSAAGVTSSSATSSRVRISRCAPIRSLPRLRMEVWLARLSGAASDHEPPKSITMCRPAVELKASQTSPSSR